MSRIRARVVTNYKGNVTNPDGICTNLEWFVTNVK